MRVNTPLFTRTHHFSRETHHFFHPEKRIDLLNFTETNLNNYIAIYRDPEAIKKERMTGWGNWPLNKALEIFHYEALGWEKDFSYPTPEFDDLKIPMEELQEWVLKNRGRFLSLFKPFQDFSRLFKTFQDFLCLFEP